MFDAIFPILWGVFALILSVYGNVMEQLTAAEGPISPNYCNNSEILEEAGLIKANLGQFLGYECSEEFYHCRWQSDGFRTYRKKCKPGLVYDVVGTQNCNYDYNVKSCGVRSEVPIQCNGTDFHCTLSDQCVPMSARCDGHYDCSMEEDEQNCPLCTSGDFACKVSEQCISHDRRCNGLIECDDGTDERDCDICGYGLFHCGKSNECIPMEERCDGRRQCPNGEDEMLCKKPGLEKKFICQSRDFEISTDQICDGVPQCPDLSDEAYCETSLPSKSQTPMVFSANLSPLPSSNTPPPLSVQPALPESEETEEEYDYEQIKNEKVSAPFPMISLGAFPPTAATMSPVTPILPKTARISVPVPAKPAFSRPRPKISPTDEKRTTINGEEYRRTKTTRKPEIGNKTPLRTTLQARPPSRLTTTALDKTVPQAIVQPFRPPVLPQPRGEKVFIMQVTASPAMQPLAKPSKNTLISRPHAKVTAQKFIQTGNDNNNNILTQITDQINNGMSPELLAKIENILKSELDGGESPRKYHPRS